MYMYIYIYMYTCVYVYVCACACAKHTCTCTCTHLGIDIFPGNARFEFVHLYNELSVATVLLPGLVVELHDMYMYMYVHVVHVYTVKSPLYMCMYNVHVATIVYTSTVYLQAVVMLLFRMWTDYIVR